MKRAFLRRILLGIFIASLSLSWRATNAIAHVGDDPEVVASGLLTVLQADDFTTGRHEVLFSLDETGTNRKFHLHFDQIPAVKLSTGAIITVKGRGRGNDLNILAANGGSVEILQPAAAA